MSSPGFILRQAHSGDGPAIARIYAPYVAGTAISFEEEVPGGEAISRRISETLPQYPYLVAESCGKLIGFSYAGRHSERASYRWSVNIAVYLDGAYHRRGIGKALYGSLLPLLTAQGYVMAYAGVTLPNPASVALHESVGFRPVAVYKNVGCKFGQWREVGWWERPLNEPAANPKEPIPWRMMPRFESLEKPQQMRPEDQQPHDH